MPANAPALPLPPIMISWRSPLRAGLVHTYPGILKGRFYSPSSKQYTSRSTRSVFESFTLTHTKRPKEWDDGIIRNRACAV